MKTKTERQKQNKKNRASGKAFELKTRVDLEKKGWIVFRNGNDVEFDITGLDAKGKPACYSSEGTKFKQAKMKWNFFTKRLMMTHSGFPDFICMRYSGTFGETKEWRAQFVECKVNGYLKPEEMEKVKWILKQLKIPIFVASKGIKRGEIKYLEMQNDKKI